MAKTIEVLVKIIPQNENKIIGWKGEVLEIGLENPNMKNLELFLSRNLGIPHSAIQISYKQGVYRVILHAKYIENPLILFT